MKLFAKSISRIIGGKLVLFVSIVAVINRSGISIINIGFVRDAPRSHTKLKGCFKDVYPIKTLPEQASKKLP
jgi:hypothetical protein